MPWHYETAMATYPNLSCIPVNPDFTFANNSNFYISKTAGNYCAGNDSAFVFLQNVLTEVMDIFQSKSSHGGGEEVGKTSWKNWARWTARRKNGG